MAKRITKSELEEMATLGALNPVDHAILAFADDAAATAGAQAFRDAGFAETDVFTLTSAELFPNLADMMRLASGAAGFGYEITLMRRYMTMASEGAGWLVVYSPDEAHTAQVQQIARSLGAKSAVQYGRLLHEDLIG